MAEERGSVRIDKWLWAARFFKSRSLAQKACNGGKVDINGVASRPHKPVRVGDIVEFTVGEWRRKVKVLRLSERRGPASVARELYEDMSPPPPRKERAIAPPPFREKGAGRPTKKERRQLRRLRGR